MKKSGERKKNQFFTFFELVYRKFPKLVFLNLAYFICILPLLCGAFYLVLGLFHIPPEIIDNTYAAEIFLKLIGLSWLPSTIKLILVALSALIYGPLTCGFTYVLRCHATEQHAWFSDLFSRAKENCKQGLALGLLDIILCLSLILYLSMDLSLIANQGTYYCIVLVMKYLAIFIMLLYFIMRFYTYTLAVSVDLKLRDILKNARLAIILGFGRNLLAVALIVIVLFSFLSTSFIDIVLMASILFSFCGFLSMYLTFPVVKKYMYPHEEIAEQTEEDAD